MPQQTGPTSEEGRQKSAQNARKHGLTSTNMFVLDNETPAEWESLLQTWIAKLEPADEAELGIVEDIAHAQWRLRRCRTWEAQILNRRMAERNDNCGGTAFQSIADESRAFDLLHRYETRHRRAVERGIVTLQKLRAPAKAAEAAEAARHPQYVEVMWTETADAEPEPEPQTERPEPTELHRNTQQTIRPIRENTFLPNEMPDEIKEAA